MVNSKLSFQIDDTATDCKCIIWVKAEKAGKERNNFYGIFDSSAAASKFAENLIGIDYRIVPIQPPDSLKP